MIQLDTTQSSRLRKLLESLQATAWRPTATGIQVEIPVMTQSTTSRNWNERDDERQEGPVIRRTTQLAFSSSSRDDTLSDKNDDEKHATTTKQQQTEWLTMECRECSRTGPEGNARAFITGPTPLSVIICTNRSTQAEMEEMMVHELVHVYDVRQLKLDLQQCENLAYSEVRAAYAAECHTNAKSWFNRSNSYCVSQTAFTATRNLFPAARSQQCVQTVLQAAMNDDRPFGTHRGGVSNTVER